jgi:4a-hydroxytetrahydrobiopterin dehydratase
MTASSTEVLTRPAASAAVSDLGWRLVVGELRTAIAVESFDDAARLVGRLVEAAGDDAEGHLKLDVRPGVVGLTLQTAALAKLTARDAELATVLSAAAADLGFLTAAGSGAHPVQVLEIAIDAMDIPAVLPFWRAVFGYTSSAAGYDEVVDPTGQAATVWFQQMDEPRTQRNRIHFDIVVGHDEAQPRIDAALAAGGHLVSDAKAPAFWILADVEGNEVCVCTWQGRDPAGDEQSG